MAQLPAKTLDELKSLVSTYADFSKFSWYTSNDEPTFHMAIGEWGEKFHIAYHNATEYIIELGKVYGSGQGWNDITARVLTGEPRSEEELAELD